LKKNVRNFNYYFFTFGESPMVTKFGVYRNNLPNVVYFDPNLASWLGKPTFRLFWAFG